MATCKFISKIKNIESQSKAVNYTKNKSKTHNTDYAKSQENAIAYITNESKTKNNEWLQAVYSQDNLSTEGEKEFFVTGIMCTKENAHQRMLEAQEMSDKPIVNYAYHAEQSFLEGANDMTPETAHEIGVRLAKELWGDEFMVLISTHLNTDHYHNHFIICSTSPITGRRFHECPAEWHRMTQKSDELCREYGLNVLSPAHKTHKKSGGEIAMEKKGIPTHRDILKNDCDIAIAQATGWNSFLSNLRKMGYQIHQSNSFVNLKLEDWDRPIRIYFDEKKDRSLGSDYTKPAIEKRIAEINKQHSVNDSYSEKEPVFYDDESEFDYRHYKAEAKQFKDYLPRTEKDCKEVNILPNVKRTKYKGSFKQTRGYPANLSITYYRITYKLCLVSMPGQPHRKRRMSAAMRKEVNKMNIYLDEIRFLRRTGIQTVSGIQLYKKNANEQIQALNQSRQQLRSELRTCKNRDEQIPIKENISKHSLRISDLRKQIRMCDDIIDNSDHVRAAANNDTRKELERYKEFNSDERTKPNITVETKKGLSK